MVTGEGSSGFEREARFVCYSEMNEMKCISNNFCRFANAILITNNTIYILNDLTFLTFNYTGSAQGIIRSG